MKLKCDICYKDKKIKNIFHFSGWIHGEFNTHIHICKKCVTEYTYDQYFIHVPDTHLKGE